MFVEVVKVVLVGDVYVSVVYVVDKLVLFMYVGCVDLYVFVEEICDDGCKVLCEVE